ncbi:hypothetical protein HK102_008572 [Quaeritorhiza haematococci]|nr:hypothetical protein HK102_008572 [Quaeritorhiza haematococci]
MKSFALILGGLLAVHAQPSCSEYDAIITSSSDLQSIQQCTSLRSLDVSNGPVTSIDLPNLQSVGTDLKIMRNRDVTSIAMPLLESVAGRMEVANNTVLEEMRLDRLQKAGEFVVSVNPNLRALKLPSGLSEAHVVRIIDNGVRSIDGLSMEQVNELEIRSNKRLSGLALQDLQNAGTVRITLNNAGMGVELKNLGNIAGDLVATWVGSFNLQSLANVGGSISMSELAAKELEVPSLISVGRDLTIRSNENLEALSMPKLQTIVGTLSLSDNPALSDLAQAFPTLRQVQGSVEINGPVQHLELPGMQELRGAFVAQADGLDCEQLAVWKVGIVQGEFSCSSQNSYSDDNGSQENRSEQTSSTMPSGTRNTSATVDNGKNNSNSQENSTDVNATEASTSNPSSNAAAGATFHICASGFIGILIIGMAGMLGI